MKEYRIIRNTVELSNGEVRHHYTVEFKTKFLWFSWWNEYGFSKWSGGGFGCPNRILNYLTYFKFEYKTDAENFIQELIDCETNKFNFTPIIVNNTTIRWVDKLYRGTFSFWHDYKTLKNKELEYRKNKVIALKQTKEVIQN